MSNLSRTRRLASLLLLAAPLALGACSGADDMSDMPDAPDAPDDPDEPDDPDAPVGTARFADLTPERRVELVRLAARDAADAPYMTYVNAEYASAASACPARTDAGDQQSYVGGGCTAGNGDVFDGRLVVRNILPYTDEPDVDPDAPMEIELEAFRAGAITLDGHAVQSSPLPASGARYTYEAMYTRAGGTLAGAYALAATCTRADFAQGHPCTLDHAIDLDVDGSFEVAGEVAWGYAGGAGWLELRGADTLRVDLDAMVDRCAPMTIDGAAAGELCW